MAALTFVDTSGFYALLVKSDEHHAEAVRWLSEAKAKGVAAVTTDYVVDETVTLLQARGCRHLVAVFLDSILTSKACRLEWIGEDRFLKARTFFLKHDDQGFSFTDCVSFVVMKELGARDALTKDSHFDQVGFRRLLQ